LKVTFPGGELKAVKFRLSEITAFWLDLPRNWHQQVDFFETCAIVHGLHKREHMDGHLIAEETKADKSAELKEVKEDVPSELRGAVEVYQLESDQSEG
jgi:hypothetical protein